MEKVECEEEEKRSSEVIEIWWVGFIKDGAWPLSSSSDSVLARVTQLTPLKHKHTHTRNTWLQSPTHMLVLVSYTLTNLSYRNRSVIKIL